MDRYEQLRGRALAGDAGGWRLGLGVLQRDGVAGWLAAWRSVPPAAAPRPVSAGLPDGEAAALVGVLTSMALGVLRTG